MVVLFVYSVLLIDYIVSNPSCSPSSLSLSFSLNSWLHQSTPVTLGGLQEWTKSSSTQLRRMSRGSSALALAHQSRLQSTMLCLWWTMLQMLFLHHLTPLPTGHSAQTSLVTFVINQIAGKSVFRLRISFFLLYINSFLRTMWANTYINLVNYQQMLLGFWFYRVLQRPYVHRSQLHQASISTRHLLLLQQQPRML